jgi:hypothetical protein
MRPSPPMRSVFMLDAMASRSLCASTKAVFILDIEGAGEGEHAVALHLVAEGGDREQIGSKRQLVPGEQGA